MSNASIRGDDRMIEVNNAHYLVWVVDLVEAESKRE